MSDLSQQPYHHGSLRSALIEAALQMLERMSPDELSLRGLAAAAGVSRAAPYAHFADKRDLLRAVSKAGFERMADDMDGAIGAADDQRGRFVAIGEAYVRFALQNPNLFRLMFSSRPISAEDRRARPYELLADGLRSYLADRGAVLDQEVARITAWSCVHGLSVLLLDNRLGVGDAGAADLTSKVTSFFTDLLATRGG